MTYIKSVEIDGIIIMSNQHNECLTLVQFDPGTETFDAVHICDWPKLKDAIDKFQNERLKDNGRITTKG
jgi:hypothetical protein